MVNNLYLGILLVRFLADIGEVLESGYTSRNFDRNGKDHAAQRGRDASEQRRA